MIEDILSAREMQIAVLIADGYEYREIGNMLGISYQTVKNHCTDIYRKLGISGNGKLRPSIMLTRMMMREQDKE